MYSRGTQAIIEFQALKDKHKKKSRTELVKGINQYVTNDVKELKLRRDNGLIAERLIKSDPNLVSCEYVLKETIKMIDDGKVPDLKEFIEHGFKHTRDNDSVKERWDFQFRYIKLLAWNDYLKEEEKSKSS